MIEYEPWMKSWSYLGEVCSILISRSSSHTWPTKGAKMKIVKMNSSWQNAESILMTVCASPLLALFDEHMK